MKLCIACGMPMERDEDFPLGDRSKEYCVHCARPDGSMQSYEERAEAMAGFVARTQGLDLVQARKAAEAMMRRLPAWKDAR
jgi:hypothetical protein